MVLSCPNNKRPRYIVSIARSLLNGMARCQPFAVRVKDQAGEEAGLLCISPHFPIDPVLSKDGLNVVPKGLADNRWMLCGIGVAIVRDFAAIDAILQHQI